MQPVEAFAVIGIEDPCTGSAEWFRTRAAALAATPPELDAHFFLGLSVARALHRLGETAEADRVLDAAGGDASDEGGMRLHSLFETALDLGLRDRANRLAVDLLATERGASSVIRARFPETAALAQLWWTCFRRWHPRDDGPAILQRGALPPYLEGHALEQAGDVDRGRALMQLASMLPLGNATSRKDLAEGLETRDLQHAADAEWETILRLGDFGSWEGSSAWAVKTAAKKVGNRLVGTDPLHAAALFQHMLMYLLKTNSSFLNPSDYVDVVHAIHRVRARGLVARGEVAAAWWDIEQAQAAQPGDADFVADMATHLAAAGRAADAEQVFADCFAAYERICSGFPRSAQDHNGLAWLAARCGRRLDDARRHAEAAVQLDPGRAAYLDTLAEVHFRLGDRERAIALEKQAVDREPKNPEFRERLKRFERGD